MNKNPQNMKTNIQSVMVSASLKKKAFDISFVVPFHNGV